MLLEEAKKILNNRGFLLEDEKSNTKSLVFKFWKTRKEGKTLSNEEAEQLLNAPDFDKVVDPKYQNFIKSSLNKVLGNAPATKPNKPAKGLFGSVELYGKPNFAVLDVPVNTETNAKEEKQEELKKKVNDIVDNYKTLKTEYKKLFSEGISDDNLAEFNKLMIGVTDNSRLKEYSELRPYFINVTPIYTARGHEFLFNHTTDVQYKKVLKKLDRYKFQWQDVFKLEDLLMDSIKNLGYKTGKDGNFNLQVYGKNCTVTLNPANAEREKTTMRFTLNDGVKFDVEKYVDETFGEEAWLGKSVIFTFARLQAAIEYMDEIYVGLKKQKDKDDKKKAEEFKKWYDSLSDIARDQYDYYQRHPNGNWSGD